MAISPQRLTIYLYSAHRAVIFAIAQLSCTNLIFALICITGSDEITRHTARQQLRLIDSWSSLSQDVINRRRN